MGCFSTDLDLHCLGRLYVREMVQSSRISLDNTRCMAAAMQCGHGHHPNGSNRYSSPKTAGSYKERWWLDSLWGGLARFVVYPNFTQGDQNSRPARTGALASSNHSNPSEHSLVAGVYILPSSR